MLLDLLISVRYSRDCKDGKISELSDFSQPLKPYAATLDRKHSKDSISVHSPPSLFADEPGELPFDEKCIRRFKIGQFVDRRRMSLRFPILRGCLKIYLRRAHFSLLSCLTTKTLIGSFMLVR